MTALAETQLPSDEALTAFLATVRPEAVLPDVPHLHALQAEATLVARSRKCAYKFTRRQMVIAIAALEAQKRSRVPSMREWLAA